MTNGQNTGGPCENTDRHLWPQTSEPGAPYESLHITKDGALGINCGGYVYAKPIREWHKLAGGPFPAMPEAPSPNQQLIAELTSDCEWLRANGIDFVGVERNVQKAIRALERLRGELRDTRAVLAACNQALQDERRAHETDDKPSTRCSSCGLNRRVRWFL